MKAAARAGAPPGRLAALDPGSTPGRDVPPGVEGRSRAPAAPPKSPVPQQLVGCQYQVLMVGSVPSLPSVPLLTSR
jgi:hypothetical protein